MEDIYLEEEELFGEDELFFSYTDKAGTIIDGNDVFVRISGYDKEELVGAPHNIIRHRDMPKAVFKLLWDYIQNDKPIAAYVKNRSKSGRYYWVLAFVFPLQECYLSIRIKPQTHFQKIAEDLYKSALEIEKEQGVEASLDFIVDSLRGFGIKDYDEFMTNVLLEEFQSVHRSSVRSGSGKNDTEKLFHKMRVTEENFFSSFETLKNYLLYKETLGKSSRSIVSISKEILFLALNTSVKSQKIENSRDVFSVLAGEIGEVSASNADLVKKLDLKFENATSDIDKLILSIVAVILQSTMGNKHLNTLQEDETLNETADQPLLAVLEEAIEKYSSISKGILASFNGIARDIGFILHEFERSFVYLDYIEVYGQIEAALLGQRGEDIAHLFLNLKTLLEHTAKVTGEIGACIEDFDKQNKRNIALLVI